MDSFSWSHLVDLGDLKERLVEQWLWSVDIAVEISAGTDVNLVLRGLFSVLKEFIENRNIEARALHLLVCLLSTSLSDGFISESEDGRLIDTARLHIIQTSLSRWMQHADVTTGCLHVLSMLSEHDKFCDIGALRTDELLLIVSNALTAHGHSKKVQLRGTKLFLRLLEYSAAGLAPMTEDILRSILVSVCFNLRFNDDDPNLVKVSCNSLDILVRNLAHHLVVPMTGEVVNLVTGVFDTQFISGNIDVTSVCLLILEKMAVEEIHLLAFCSNSDILTKICETLLRISDLDDSRTSYGHSVIATFNILNRIIPDPHILSMVIHDDDAKTSCIDGLYLRLKSLLGGSRSTMTFAKEFDLPYSQQSKLADLANEVLQAMRQILGRPDDDKLTIRANDDAQSIGSEHETIKDDEEVTAAVEGVEDHTSSDIELLRKGAVEPGPDHSIPLVAVAASNIQIVEDASDSTVGEDTERDHVDHANIIQVAAVSQQQAAVTMVRAEIMHRLFIDATQKIENLIIRGQELQTQVETLTINKHSGTEEENGRQVCDIVESDREAKLLVNEDANYELNGLNSFNDAELPMMSDDGLAADRSQGDAFSADGWKVGVLGDRLWLAVAGTVEALTIITLTAETGSKYGFESTFEYSSTKISRRALLQYGDKTLLKPSQWAKYEPVAEIGGIGVCYAVGSETVSAEAIYTLATQALKVFLYTKDGGARLNGGAGRSKQSIISLTLFRQVLKNMNVFLMRDVDIVFSRLAVPTISLFGFCFALTLCAQKLEKRWSCAEDIVLRLTSILTTAVAAPTKFILPVSPASSTQHFEAAQSSGGVSVSTDIEDQLTAEDMSELLENVRRNSKALSFIFSAYLSSGTGGGGSHRGDTGGGAAGAGVSFEGVSKFAQDFDLYPNVVVHSQLFKIFGDIVANPVQYGNASASQSHVKLSPRKFIRRDVSGGEPLLSFRQFEALIVLVALRSSYFREAVEALTNLDRLLTAASPQRGSLLQTVQAQSDGGHRAAFVLSVERINRLIRWMNGSRGKDRLASRARSITSTRLTLKSVSISCDILS